MQARCDSCGAVYQVGSSAAGRVARCKSCGEKFRVPVGEEDPWGPLPAQDSREPRRPLVLILVAVFLIFSGFMNSLYAIGQLTLEELEGGEVNALLSAFLAGAAFLSGGGLLARKPWGWWMAVVLQSGSLFLHGKYVFFWLSRLRWSHPEAGDIARAVGLHYGVPALVALVVLVGLGLPKVRIVVGVKDKPRERRRLKGRIGGV